MSSKKFIAMICGGVLASASAFAQQEYSKQDISVQAIGSFVKSTASDGVQQSATNSGGVLATYRYFLNNHNGVEVNYAWTNDTERYLSSGTSTGVGANANEATAAYVFRMPLKHFTPFVLAGAGALVFSPRDFVSGDTQARPAFVYGAGADFNLSHRVFIRAEYRGLVYNSPTFGVTGLDGLDRTTHRAEPSVGFGYRF